MTEKLKFKVNLTIIIIAAIMILAIMADTYLPITEWFFSGEFSKTSDDYYFAEYALSSWQTAYLILALIPHFLIKRSRDWVSRVFKFSYQPGLQWPLILKTLIAIIFVVGLTYTAAFLTIKWMGPKEAFYFIPNMFYVIIPLLLVVLIVSYRIRKRNEQIGD